MDRKLNKHPLYILLYVLFAFFVVMPIVYTFGTTIFNEEAIANSLLLLKKESLLLLAKSILLASLVALVSTLLGTVLGFLLYKTSILWRRFFKVALLIPLFMSPYILAVAWKDFFYIIFDNTHILFSFLGVALVLITIFTPLSILIIGSALTNIDARLEDAAILLTNRFRVVLKILLPLIKPALITSFVLVFIFSLSEFSVPAFFGVKVFTTEIFTQFSAFYNHSFAILQSALLVLICILLLLSERKYITDAPFLSIGDKGINTKTYPIEKGQWKFFLLLIGWLLISVVFPFFILFSQALKDGTDKLMQAFNLLLPTMASSVALAFAGAVIIVLIGFSAAMLGSKNKTKLSRSFDGFLLIAFAIPSTIMGISLIYFYNRPSLGFIYATYAIILIAYVGKYSFISAKLIGNALKQIPDSFDEAAQIEGVSLNSSLRRIILPLIFPSLLAAFVIGFIFSLGELGISIMLYPPGTEIMPIKVFTIMANAPQSLTSSMTLIVFSITLLIIISFYFLVKIFFRTND